MTARNPWLLLLALFATSSAVAVDDYNAIFKEAVNGVDFDFAENWAYTETRVDSEHVWIGRFDPRGSSRVRWELLSVDDRAPTEEEIEKFNKDKAHDHSDNSDNRVNSMVEPDSVRLIEDSDEYWLLGFNPDEDQEKIMDSVDATIRVKKSGTQLEYVDLRNHRPVKPAVGVKLSRLITRLTFGPATEGGPVVPLSTQVHVTGRAFLVISFDEQELTRNSDFEYAGEQ
jgi:hypothetical protein